MTETTREEYIRKYGYDAVARANGFGPYAPENMNPRGIWTDFQRGYLAGLMLGCAGTWIIVLIARLVLP